MRVNQFEKYKQLGLCSMCAQPLDRKGVCCARCAKRKNEAQNKKYLANKERYKENGICLACRTNPVRPGGRMCQICFDRSARRRSQLKLIGLCPCGRLPEKGRTCDLCLTRCKNLAQRLRDEVFNHYGGYICKCCGETEPQFLHIDHINNGGTKHRAEIGNKMGSGFYGWLRKNGFPEGFQALCANCNLAKGFYGICPHERKRQALTVLPMPEEDAA